MTRDVEGVLSMGDEQPIYKALSTKLMYLPMTIDLTNSTSFFFLIFP